MRQIELYFPLSHGVPRVDDGKVLSSIIFVIQDGLRWRDAPAACGPHEFCAELISGTICDRFIRWSRLGVFDTIFAKLATGSGSDVC